MDRKLPRDLEFSGRLSGLCSVFTREDAVTERWSFK